MRSLLNTLAAAASLAAASMSVAYAQNYPTQTIRWVVPYPAGGGTDVLARTLADAMRPALGQPIVIDNKPGATTLIGAEFTAKAKPDGYTIMSADNATLAFNPHLYKKLPYDPAKDFTYVGLIGRFPMVLVVNPSVPAKSLREFREYVAREGGKVNYGSPGVGSPHHIGMEFLKERANLDMTHVPYKGAAPAIQDLLGGQVPVMLLDLASVLPHIKAGKVRPIAIATGQRAKSIPTVPTMAEEGLPNMEAYAWQGVLAPAGLPQPVLARLNQELNAALKAPAVVSKFEDFGMEFMPGEPAQFQRFAADESKRWGELIRKRSISLE